MSQDILQVPAFLAGDHVVLTRGGNAGTPGIFLNLREDANWADIRERDGKVKMHPMEWLANGPAGIS